MSNPQIQLLERERSELQEKVRMLEGKLKQDASSPSNTIKQMREASPYFASSGERHSTRIICAIKEFGTHKSVDRLHSDVLGRQPESSPNTVKNGVDYNLPILLGYKPPQEPLAARVPLTARSAADLYKVDAKRS